MAQIRFHVDVTEEPDGSYWAEVQELPGCFASGFSLDELQEAAFEAIQLWLPDGIELENAVWKVVDDSGNVARAKLDRKKPPARSKMLVCA
jgi:predicted RNase H-like HicB family nuclease